MAKKFKAEAKPAKEAAPKEAEEKVPRTKMPQEYGGVDYADEEKIKVLDKTNPSRAGSKRAEAFDHLLNSCKTVGDYRMQGYKLKYLHMAVALDLISIG